MVIGSLVLTLFPVTGLFRTLIFHRVSDRTYSNLWWGGLLVNALFLAANVSIFAVCFVNNEDWYISLIPAVVAVVQLALYAVYIAIINFYAYSIRCAYLEKCVRDALLNNGRLSSVEETAEYVSAEYVGISNKAATKTVNRLMSGDAQIAKRLRNYDDLNK